MRTTIYDYDGYKDGRYSGNLPGIIPYDSDSANVRDLIEGAAKKATADWQPQRVTLTIGEQEAVAGVAPGMDGATIEKAIRYLQDGGDATAMKCVADSKNLYPPTPPSPSERITRERTAPAYSQRVEASMDMWEKMEPFAHYPLIEQNGEASKHRSGVIIHNGDKVPFVVQHLGSRFPHDGTIAPGQSALLVMDAARRSLSLLRIGNPDLPILVEGTGAQQGETLDAADLRPALSLQPIGPGEDPAIGKPVHAERGARIG